jgi:histone demethylase JARID1
VSWYEEIGGLPFQPEEEEVLKKIIDNGQKFRDHISAYCNPILSTEAEADTQRFYLRKIEGAEILLSFETNFFRQELHKWCPVAPEPPPVTDQSKSTRKPRPTKLQKMLAHYGVDDPEDLPEAVKGKANSLKRKQLNAEAAAAAAGGSPSGQAGSPVGYNNLQSLFSRSSQPPSAGLTGSGHGRGLSSDGGHRSRGSDVSLSIKGEAGEMEGLLHPNLLHAEGGGVVGGGPKLMGDHSSLSLLEEQLVNGEKELTESAKNQYLDVLRRSEHGRRRAEEIFGPDIWSEKRRVPSLGNGDDDDDDDGDDEGGVGAGGIRVHHDDGAVDKMFTDLTNQDDEEDNGPTAKRKDGDDKAVAATGSGGIDATLTADSLESERNGMDALLDGE